MAKIGEGLENRAYIGEGLEIRAYIGEGIDSSTYKIAEGVEYRSGEGVEPS